MTRSLSPSSIRWQAAMARPCARPAVAVRTQDHAKRSGKMGKGSGIP